MVNNHLKNICIVLDSYPDFRTRRRLSQFTIKNTSQISIFIRKNRGIELKHSSNDSNFKPLSKRAFNSIINSDILYISGNSMLPVVFILTPIFKFLKKQIIYEVCDVPLFIRNNYLKKVFTEKIQFLCWSICLNLLSPVIILSSPRFAKYLSKRCTIFISHNYGNYPPLSCKKSLADVNFVYAGFIRYIPQLHLLINFCIKNELRFTIYGGPEEEFLKLKNHYLHSEKKFNNCIKYGGAFSSTDLPNIYNNCDFVYAVYDSNLINCRLALPNKLYEASFYCKPILVAENTYVNEIVTEFNVGFGLPINNQESFDNKLREILNSKLSISFQKYDSILSQAMKTENKIQDYIKVILQK